MLVTPDGTLGGAADWIGENLSRHGFTMVAGRLVQLNAAAMQEVYRSMAWRLDNDGYPMVEFSWAMHGKIYELAPACLILLTHPAVGACQALRECKGYRRPELAGPAALRHTSENVIFNFVHCPDDTPSAIRELTVLTGEEARLLLAVRDSQDPDLRRLVGAESMLKALPSFCGRQSVSLPVVVNRIRLRIIQRLALELAAAGADLAELTLAQRLLAEEGAALEGLATARERLERARGFSAEIHAGLMAAAARAGSDIASRGLDAIAQLYDLRGQRRLSSILALAGYGVYLAPLERIILESHSYVFTPGNELIEIYEKRCPLS